jgi:hypothetical protein
MQKKLMKARILGLIVVAGMITFNSCGIFKGGKREKCPAYGQNQTIQQGVYHASLNTVSKAI